MVNSNACLPSILELAVADFQSSIGEVTGGVTDIRALSSQFQNARDQVFRGSLVNELASLGAPSEAEQVKQAWSELDPHIDFTLNHSIASWVQVLFNNDLNAFSCTGAQLRWFYNGAVS